MHLRYKISQKLLLTAVVLMFVFGTGFSEDHAPEFVECPEGIVEGSHCDTILVQCGAIDPENASNSDRVRYRLINGVGGVDEVTGLWTYKPNRRDTLHEFQPIEVGAFFKGSAGRGFLAEDTCEFLLRLFDNQASVSLDGRRGASVVLAKAPGMTSVWLDVEEDDPCDEGKLGIHSCLPEPAGFFQIVNNRLRFHAKHDDAEKRFKVFLNSDHFLDDERYVCIFDTRTDPRPEFTVCPDHVSVEACQGAHVSVMAPTPGDPNYYPACIDFELVSGPGSISNASPGNLDARGTWTWVPTLEELGNEYEVEIAASYAGLGTSGDDNCRFTVSVVRPEASLWLGGWECGDTVSVRVGRGIDHKIHSTDADCEPLDDFSIVSVTPEPYGQMDVSYCHWYDSTSRCMTFVPVAADAGRTYFVTLEGTDGTSTYTCGYHFAVQGGEPFMIEIDTISDQPPGQIFDVAVNMSQFPTPISGLNLQVGYPGGILNQKGVLPGDFIVDSGWEYFTYRMESTGQSGTDCPSHAVRILGYFRVDHPQGCYPHNELPAELVKLTFAIKSGAAQPGEFVPINFVWLTCIDNTLGEALGDTTYFSRYVFDEDGIDITQNTSMPSRYGAPDMCLAADPVFSSHRIDFRNGGVRLATAPERDLRGDIDNDSLAFSIADAVLYSDYFKCGPTVFEDHVEESTEASDVNLDGVPLTMADLLYMIEVIVGDRVLSDQPVQPFEDTAIFIDHTAMDFMSVTLPDTMCSVYMLFDGVVSVDHPFHVSGLDCEPTDGYTRVRFTADAGELFIGYSGAGKLVEAHATTCDLRHVFAKITYDNMTDVGEIGEGNLPRRFALHQNHPNPFNAGTTIAFDLPDAARVVLDVYDIQGRKVTTLWQGRLPAGNHFIEWDGTDRYGQVVASGVYLYRLMAGDEVASRKMILLK